MNEIQRLYIEQDDNIKLCIHYKQSDMRNSKNEGVILIHSATYSSIPVYDLRVSGYPEYDFSTILRLSSLGYNVYALDLDGYGFSTQRNRFSSIDDCTKDILKVVNYIKLNYDLKKIYMLGWSFGGHLASHFVGKYKGMIDKAILYSTYWGGGKAGPPPHLLTEKWDIPKELRRENNPEHASEDFIDDSFFEDGIKQAFVDLALTFDKTSPTTARYIFSINKTIHDPTELHIPILCIHGDKDPSIQVQDINEFYDLIPHNMKEHVVIRDSFHNSHQGRNRNAFYSAIYDFLTRDY